MTLPLIVPDWNAPDAVRAVATTRVGGVSRDRYASLNLGDHVGDLPEAVRENRARLAARLDLQFAPRWLHQVHGTSVVRADEAHDANSPRPPGDASVAFAPGPACVVLTADCLPVLICDRAGTRVAAAHAGWRGLAAGVLTNAVAALQVSPDRLLAWLGPAIGPAAFEVGDEVRARFVERSPAHARAFAGNARGRWQADLYALARIELEQLGLTDVSGGGFCTHAEADRFFSYRRDGATGRMATLIWLQPGS
jgi:YfiH family protein